MTNGAYVLNNERPTTQKLIRWTHSSIVNDIRTNLTRSASILFRGLRLNARDKELLLLHREKLATAVLEYESAQMQLLDAKRVYAQRLETRAGGDGMKLSLQNERLLLAIAEVDSMKPMLSATLTKGEWATRTSWMVSLEEAIADSECFLEADDRFSPFGDLPRIAMGQEAIRSFFSRRVNRLETHLPLLEERLKSSNTIPVSVSTAVILHFKQQVSLIRSVHLRSQGPEVEPREF